MTRIRRRMQWSALAAIIAAVGVQVAAQDWPQFLGPARDGRYSGPPLAASWADGGPPRLWSRPVGAGFAGPAVTGDRVILFHRVGRREVVEALAAATGDTVWRYDYATSYRDDFGFDEGPRSVPVVDNGRVYTFGAQGQLHAVDLETGAGVWQVDTHERYDVRKGFFGAAGSPLVEDGRVIANVGGRRGGIVAFDAATGDELWTAPPSGGGATPSSSPAPGSSGSIRHRARCGSRNGGAPASGHR